MKSAPEYFYHIQWGILSQLSWKKSLLLAWKISVLFGNTLAAREKYPAFKRDNLGISIQVQLSHKQKTFSQFLPEFLKSSLNFKYFDQKPWLS